MSLTIPERSDCCLFSNHGKQLAISLPCCDLNVAWWPFKRALAIERPCAYIVVLWNLGGSHLQAEIIAEMAAQEKMRRFEEERAIADAKSRMQIDIDARAIFDPEMGTLNIGIFGCAHLTFPSSICRRVRPFA
jgi:hypothetical protein